MKRAEFRLSSLTFQQRLILSMTALLFATTIGLAILGSRIAEDFMFQRFRDRMEFLARYLAANAELGILLGDRDMLERMASNLLSEEDVITVRILDDKGQVLAKAGNMDDKSRIHTAKAKVFMSMSSENLAFALKSEDAVGNKYIGTVEISYITSSIEELTTELEEKYAILTLVIVSIGIVIFLFFTKSLTAPLSQLVDAAHEVATGNLDVRLEEGSLPETRKIARSFNTMTEALKQSRADLEDTYQNLIQKQALAEIGHFAVTVAHEVKNPLGIIKGALDVLKKNGIDNDTRDTMIAYVEDEIQRLNRLIKDFLDFSRPKPLKFAPFDMVELLSEIVERMNLEWDPRGIKITLVAKLENCRMTGDRDALTRALINIIKNACEVSPKDAEVKVELFVVQNEGGPREIHVRVIDWGRGIPDDKKKEIFDPFFTDKAKGTGLGLTFTKKVIDAHMGQILVEDNKPTGTCMEIILDG